MNTSDLRAEEAAEGYVVAHDRKEACIHAENIAGRSSFRLRPPAVQGRGPGAEPQLRSNGYFPGSQGNMNEGAKGDYDVTAGGVHTGTWVAEVQGIDGQLTVGREHLVDMAAEQHPQTQPHIQPLAGFAPKRVDTKEGQGQETPALGQAVRRWGRIVPRWGRIGSRWRRVCTARGRRVDIGGGGLVGTGLRGGVSLRRRRRGLRVAGWRGWTGIGGRRRRERLIACGRLILRLGRPLGRRL